MDQIINLINELNKASELYYNGKESFLTDREFDLKLNQLKELEQKSKVIYSNSPTVRVGAPVLTELNKIQIKDKPMLSLDKVHSAEEILDFYDGYDMMVGIKCDGLSVRLIYKDTDLVSANTRGDGYIGGDITEHVKHFLNVPIKIAKTGTYIIDGEAIIYDKDFEIINKNGDFKNNRNTASGSLALLDMSIVESRRLSFLAWDVIEGGSYNEYHYNMEEADELGFDVAPGFIIDATNVTLSEIDKANQKVLDIAKQDGIPCDGVVWRINDIKEGAKKGQTAHHFLNAIAWKPEQKEYETQLQDIEWSLGRTGVLTPVAIFDDVEIDGTVCNRASLHNVSVLREIMHTPYIGQKVKVIKSNMIIPQITWAADDWTADKLVLLEAISCPVCGKQTKLVESESGVLNLICDNSSCEGQLSTKIDHFCSKKGLDIKGLSRKTIEKLIEWGWLNNLIDLFSLDKYKKEWVKKDGFGEASVSKILDAIDRGRRCRLDQFICSIGIPLVGSTVAKEICKYYDTWEDFRNAVSGDWTEFEGFGPEISKAINSFDYTEADVIAARLDFQQPEVQSETPEPAPAIKDKVFVITGKLSRKRDDIKAEIEALGGKVTGSVSSKTNYLICNDKNSTTGKSADAKKLGIPVITEEEYLQMK